jgi:hypothetical protein
MKRRIAKKIFVNTIRKRPYRLATLQRAARALRQPASLIETIGRIARWTDVVVATAQEDSERPLV